MIIKVSRIVLKHRFLRHPHNVTIATAKVIMVAAVAARKFQYKSLTRAWPDHAADVHPRIIAFFGTVSRVALHAHFVLIPKLHIVVAQQPAQQL